MHFERVTGAYKVINNYLFSGMRTRFSTYTYVASVVAMGLLSASAWANQEVYTFLGPDRKGYTYELLTLALTKTAPESGSFQLRITPPMNEARALKSMKSNHYVRPIRRFEAQPWAIKDPTLTTIPFPVYLGVFGYRVCAVNKTVANAFAIATSVEMLKPFSFGQVMDWRDVDILKSHGLKVHEGINRKSLYHLVNVGRVDSFCRAAVELSGEAPLYQDLEDLRIDQSIALYYPLPFFFSVRADDPETAKRVEVGLKRAFEDGSLMALWERYHDRAEIERILKGRRIIALDNPVPGMIEVPIEHYLFRPSNETSEPSPVR